LFEEVLSLTVSSFMWMKFTLLMIFLKGEE
jgi:hypothetical protein